MRIEQRPGWTTAVSWLREAVRNVSNDGRVEQTMRLPAGLAERDLADFAEFHGIPGFARLAVSGTSTPLEHAVHAAQTRHLRSVTDLVVVVDALDRVAVDVLVAKGPSLVATSYAGPHLRSYVDLDLLVRPGDLKTAVRALEGAGCTVLDANWPLLRENRVQELRLEGPSGGAIDLHWSLSSGGSPDENTAPPAAVLLNRSSWLDDPNIRFRGLSPADLVVHVAVHAAGSGGHRLVWLADLRGALTWSLTRVTPRELVEVAEEWGALPALAVMAYRVQRQLGWPVPEELLDAGLRGPWGFMVAGAERAAPPLLAGQGGSLSRLVARSCRATPRASLGTAARKMGAWVRLGAPNPPGAEVMHDPTNPQSALYASGGRDGAEAFYDWVARRESRPR